MIGARHGQRTRSLWVLVVGVAVLAVAGMFGWLLATVLDPSFGVVLVGLVLVVAVLAVVVVLPTTPSGP